MSNLKNTIAFWACLTLSFVTQGWQSVLFLALAGMALVMEFIYPDD